MGKISTRSDPTGESQEVMRERGCSILVLALLLVSSGKAEDAVVTPPEKQSNPVWYILAKDEGHGFQKKANQGYEFYSGIVFLQEYLLK